MDFCTAMRCMPVWNGQTLTFVQDRSSDVVWTYTAGNVVTGEDGVSFRYSFSALKDRHTAVEVNYVAPQNVWQTSTELVEDPAAIVRYGRNLLKMDAFGCTGRSGTDTGVFRDNGSSASAVSDPTVQFEFWFSDTKITVTTQVETSACFLGTGASWSVSSTSIRPGKDYFFYIHSVNQVGKSAFVEAVGRASDDAKGYLDFFKGLISESHLGAELLGKVELSQDNASKLEQFSKEWQDANKKWNAMWGVKIEQTEDGKHYVAGLGLSMEDTEEGKQSQFLVASNRITFIDPANGNKMLMFVAQGDQVFMNDVFMKSLTSPPLPAAVILRHFP